MDTTNLPLAATGLNSFRYRGPFGFIMIGATDIADAMREAQRSTLELVSIKRLEKWDGQTYKSVGA